jgi:hypothetical protein
MLQTIGFLMAILFGGATLAQNAPRVKLNINRAWKFELGDHRGAEAVLYNDSGWTEVNLPHNFSIPYFGSAKWYTGYGWYRKTFDIPASWNNKRVFIEFEGAFRVAEVFVNGVEAGQHNGGYTGFSFDITKLVRPGSNVLAVRLNNLWSPRLAPRNGDHNFTGGIYRDVYLVATEPVYVTWYGTYVTTPNLSEKSGDVYIATEIRNANHVSKVYTVKTVILNKSRQVVASVSNRQSFPADSVTVVNQLIKSVRKPELWSPEHPSLYEAVSYILDGNKIIDKYVTSFGFRWIKWTADQGFFLNGKHYYFRGANVHQDHAGWASAITNSAIFRDVKMIKDCGMDFIRGSHYPHAPSFSSACDSLGVLLWEENDFWGSGGTQKETGNWFDGAGAYPINVADQEPFEHSVMSDLREMIRIHRNHPSIIAWSMCNEPFFTAGSTMPKVREFLKKLVALTHSLDPTRPAAIGGCQRGDIDKIGDVAGYNGDGARLFINPGIPNVVTEYGSTIARRPGKFDPGWGDLQNTEFSWRSGQALWCGFDYGTRAGKFGMMGMIDYFRLPKNIWYWYRNEYKHIPPPVPARKGKPTALNLYSTSNYIAGTDGTDDVQLIVSVIDSLGRQLDSCPDVTLTIVSGPGEFPTGRTITFKRNSDIYIRDGKAAIEFRSYYGGKSIIVASSPGLLEDSVVVETKGVPRYIDGVSTLARNRMYNSSDIPDRYENRLDFSSNIAFQKPTNVSSEAIAHAANLANDNDDKTAWQSKNNDELKWWEVDLENIYRVKSILVASSPKSGRFKIQVSGDNTKWITIASDDSIRSINGLKTFVLAVPAIGRFLKIKFEGQSSNAVSLSEVKVYGIPVSESD